MRFFSGVILLLSVAVVHAQVQPFQELNLDTKFACDQLKDPANDATVAGIVRSQLSGIDVGNDEIARMRDRIGTRACTPAVLQEAMNYVLNAELAKRDIRGVELHEAPTALHSFVVESGAAPALAPDLPLPEVPGVSADQVSRDLTKKVDKLGDALDKKIEGLTQEIKQLRQLNLPKRPMQFGSEIVYTYAAIVGRRWTPTTEVLIEGELCGKGREDEDKKNGVINRRCRVVELQEEGQFACWDWDLFYRTCYDLTLEEETENGKKVKVKQRFDVKRARDDLPSEVYLPMLADAEKHAGTKPIVGTTYDRLVNVQRTRNEQDYERTRAHIGALAAVNFESSQSLLTAAALHLYLSEQPWLPGRIDLVRRTSLLVLYGQLDLGAAKAQTLGIGAAFDIVRGFSLTIGYSRYTLDTALDPSLPPGTEVHTGGGFAGLSINTEIVNNNSSLSGLFSQ